MLKNRKHFWTATLALIKVKKAGQNLQTHLHAKEILIQLFVVKSWEYYAYKLSSVIFTTD